jgi:hypothetical protein
VYPSDGETTPSHACRYDEYLKIQIITKEEQTRVSKEYSAKYNTKPKSGQTFTLRYKLN